jgi:hypothetical protein
VSAVLDNEAFGLSDVLFRFRAGISRGWIAGMQKNKKMLAPAGFIPGILPMIGFLVEGPGACAGYGRLKIGPRHTRAKAKQE